MDGKLINRVVLSVAGLLVAAGSVLVLWHAPPARRPSSPSVATVNGRPITRTDLDLRLDQILPMASFHGTIAQDRLLGLRRAALDELVLDEIIHQEAAGRGVTADAVEIEQELAQARSRFADEDEFRRALSEVGLTVGGFRRWLGRTVVIRRERASHVGREPTEIEMQAYYESSRGKFLRPEQVHLHEILLRVAPGDPQSAASAERRAKAIAARLRRGEPFGALARLHSEDEYRVRDGDLGFVHRGRLDAELEEVVFAAPLNGVGIARSLSGVHVFRVTERTAAAQLSFEEAKPIIADRLRRESLEQDERRWKERLLAGARVEILDPVLRATSPAELPRVDLPRARRVATAG